MINTLRKCNSAVSYLGCSNNQLDDECMKSLGDFVKNNQHLERLNVGYNKISDKGIEIISEQLIGNMVLKILYLNWNKRITDASNQCLIKMIQSSHVQHIDIQHTSITQKNLIAVPLTHNAMKYGSNALRLSDM